MAETTKIEWATSTFNPWTGCTKVSPGCANCYAEGWAKRSGIVKWGPGQARRRTSDKLWRDVRRWNGAAEDSDEPHRVFCASLADWLDHEVPTPWLADLLDLVAETLALTWMLLTKRPQLWGERMRAVDALAPGLDVPTPGIELARAWLRGEAPANVWVGTTVEDQQRADERIPALLAIPARVRFLSCEPLLGPVDLGLADGIRAERFQSPRASALHWVIAGGESGHGARPMHPAWARSLRDQAQAAGVAFHFKQWGEYVEVVGQPGEDDGTVEAGDGTFTHMRRVGKKAAGRLLDGRTWDELPEVPRG